MKIVIAAMAHETNSFSPIRTDLASFFQRFDAARVPPDEMIRGEAALRATADTNTAFAGMVRAARHAEARIEVPLLANAIPSGPADNGAFERMCEAIVSGVREGCDAVMLALHGAMVAEGCDDPESELASRIRSVLPGVPVAVALDFHANIGRRLIDNVDVLTGYRTYPHVDMAETGERAARTLLAMLRGECAPVIAFEWLPMMPHTAQCSPSREPMKSIMDRAIAAEAGGEVLNASVFGGFPHSDAPETGLSVVVVGRDAPQARGLCRELAQRAWNQRAGFRFDPEPMQTTLERAAALTDHPVLLADHGNNAFGGGTCDTMQVLRAMLGKGMNGIVAGPYADPRAVARMIDAGVGATLTIPVGGNTDMPAIGLRGEPLVVSGTVRAITDGRFTVSGPMMTGIETSIGRTAVLDTGAARIVVSEERLEPFDLGIFTHCGVDPARARYVLIGSRQHFRAAFEPIARHVLLVAGPGVCSSDMSAFRYRKIRRPIYPLDENANWTPSV